MVKNFLILCSLFIFSFGLKCGEEEIENCEICGTGDNLNSCTKCIDKHFLFFNNLYCLPCNHKIYGQIGCKGNCDSSYFKETRFVFCNQNDCEDGYYNLNGICFKCSDGSPGCKTCSVEESIVNDEKNYNYVCTECINNEYKLNEEFKTCDPCKMEYCEKCHFNENGNKECDKCEYGFYLRSDKTCQKCNKVSIPNGYCRVCSNDLTNYNSGYCWCENLFYTIKEHSTCEACPENCPYCEYNEKNGKTECKSCSEGYTINSQKTCSKCDDGCKYCKFDNNLNSVSVCISCFSDTFLIDNKCLICPNNCKRCTNENKCTECNYGYALDLNGNCIKCPNECDYCKVDQNNNKVCTKCTYSNYALNNMGQCKDCSYEQDTGGLGCNRCRYNKSTNKYECLECKKEESGINYGMIDNYAYINNTFQCLSNQDPDQYYLYGCIKGKFIKDNEYECYTCKNDFIPIINDNICRKRTDIGLSNYCEKAKNFGGKDAPIYSCEECNIDTTKIININNVADCQQRSNELVYCLEAKILEDGTSKECTKCVPNSHLNENKICINDNDSFGYRNLWCYKCDDKEKGNIGCIASEGCDYIESNNQINCHKCKDDYFSFTYGQCFSCSLNDYNLYSNRVKYCDKCHIDSNDQYKCDKCLGYFTYNSENKECELDYEEHPEFSPGCIIFKDKIDEYTKNKKCQICKPGYFLTKLEECIYCNSEKYGGPSCNKCGYEVDENGRETEKIICKNCEQEYQILSSEGKCYNCKYDLQDSCERCKFIKNENDNNEKLVCTLCQVGYFLDSNGNCVNYLHFLKNNIPYCYEYSYNIGNIEIIKNYDNSISFSNSDKYCMNYKKDKECKLEINEFIYNKIKE